MDKRKNLNNTDKIKLLEELFSAYIDNKFEISFYSKDDKEFNTLTDFCRKYDLHEYHVHRDSIYWVYFHNGYNKKDVVSANVQICIFEPR